MGSMDRNNCKVQLELTLKDAREFPLSIIPEVVVTPMVLVQPAPMIIVEHTITDAPPVAQPGAAISRSEEGFPIYPWYAESAQISGSPEPDEGLKLELDSITANLPSFQEKTPEDTGSAPQTQMSSGP